MSPSCGTIIVTPVRTGPSPTTRAPSPRITVAWPTRTPRTSVIALAGPGRPYPIAMPRSRARTCVSCDRPVGAPGRPAGARSPVRPSMPIIACVIRTSSPRSAAPSDRVRLLAMPELAGLRPIDVAEAFRDLPGLALLESARPGRNARWSYLTADPVAVLTEPAVGGDPFAVARRLLARLAPSAPPRHQGGPDAPPFLGGLVGFLAYELGDVLERLPSPPADDQGLPPLRLALHDWTIAWDRRTGGAWLAGRALDGDADRLTRRLADVRERIRPSRLARAAELSPLDDAP